MGILYLPDQQATIHVTTIIHDGHETPRYLLSGKWGRYQDALTLSTMSGRLLAEVRQLSLGFSPRFALYSGRERVGTMAKSFGFLREFLYIRGLHWVVVGAPLTGRYRVFAGNRLVFSTEPVHGGRYTKVTVGADEDEPLAALVAAVLNHWAHRTQRDPLRIRPWHRLHPATGDLGLAPTCKKNGRRPAALPLIN